MKPVLATDPAVRELVRIFGTAIDNYSEEIEFEFRLPRGARIRYKSFGNWTDVLSPPTRLCSPVAMRLRRMIEMLPTEDGDRWHRYQFEKPQSMISPFMRDHEMTMGPQTWFVDMQLTSTLALAGDKWCVRFHVPLFRAFTLLERGDYLEGATILEQLLPRENNFVTTLYADMLRGGRGLERDHNKAQQLLRSIGHPESQWCLIGNIVEQRPYGPGGEDKMDGTKHFKPGAKVYCMPPQWGDGYENIKVVGRHRCSNEYVTMVIQSYWVTNWRAKVIYSPAVIHRLNWAGSMWRSEIIVRSWVKILRERESEKTFS